MHVSGKFLLGHDEPINDPINDPIKLDYIGGKIMPFFNIVAGSFLML